MSDQADPKTRVRDFWNEKSCGEVYATGDSELAYYESHRKARYELEPYLVDFARFTEGHGQDVLEIGVGMGADHVEWARSTPRSLTGIDLTPRAIDHTRTRMALYGFGSTLQVADAENLPFEDAAFDLIFSWGVLHHSPNTSDAVDEVYRTLRVNGTARIMMYHKHSLTGYLLWTRYALLAGRPFRTLSDVYSNHLESPGTKAFSADEARLMFRRFSRVKIRTQLSFGDLLQGSVGQRHKGMLLTVAKRLWPRWILGRLFKNHGLALLVEATK